MAVATSPARSHSPTADRAVPSAAGGDLSATLMRRIDARTGRRITQLEVLVQGDRVVVRGLAPSYYVKQLALSAILEVLDPAETSLALEIEVGSLCPQPA